MLPLLGVGRVLGAVGTATGEGTAEGVYGHCKCYEGQYAGERTMCQLIS